MKDLKLRDKVRTLLYMIGMVAVLFMAETTIAYATSDDDDLSNSILSEQPVDENRTNIREPGSSENADDLKQLNIAKVGLLMKNMRKQRHSARNGANVLMN